MLNIDSLPWHELHAQLDETGFARTGVPVLSRDECDQIATLYDAGAFRSRVDMARHRFGEGEYKYFDHPLPDPVTVLRRALYPHLARGRQPLGGAARRGRRAIRTTLDEFLAAATPPARRSRRR